MKDGVFLLLFVVVVKFVFLMFDGSWFVWDIEIIDKLNGWLIYVFFDEEIRYVGIV